LRLDFFGEQLQPVAFVAAGHGGAGVAVGGAKINL
jgi:hypothetical protein